MLSPTISVRPSGVITVPFGNSSPSATTSTVPSGCTRASAAGLHRRVAELEPEVAHVRGAVGGDDHVVAPAGRDRRQVGVGRRPRRRARPGARGATPSPPRGGDRRATSRDRSGSRRARARPPASPSSPTLDTVCWWKSENHSRPSCQRGPSPKPMPLDEAQGGRTRGEPTALESPHACCRAERAPRARGRRRRRSVARDPASSCCR